MIFPVPAAELFSNFNVEPKKYIAVILLILLAGCTKVNRQSPDQDYHGAEASREISYFPLSDGTEWIYTAQYFTPATGVQDAKVATRIEGSEIINGKAYYRLITVFSGIPGAMDETNYYRASKDGVYIVHGKQKNNPEQMYLPLPLKAGQTWTVNGPDGVFEYRMEGMETAHLIEKKYDNCLKISFEGNQVIANPAPFEPKVIHFTGLSYRAPAIGEVKSDIKMTRGEIKASVDLVLDTFKQ